MPYATQQDLVDRFGAAELVGLSDRAATGEIDAAVVAGALADAEELVNGYLAKRYALPLSVQPARLTGVVCDLARYALYTYEPPEVVRTRHKDAVAWLRDVAAGVVQLPAAGAEPAAPAGEAGAAVAFDAEVPAFTRDSLKGWG